MNHAPDCPHEQVRLREMIRERQLVLFLYYYHERCFVRFEQVNMSF